ncbi:hypothetical protein BTUL_0070g00140 [Botrytis tulipae]|uniref:Uncharacterized protein n=1 Tax=Botrytis tulipae TaxID=87230 RepID=A0A4Z1ELR8_9HELO|nr:hypothetical protein BTUL_0070g00140 [Botrytis tulipae]
MLANSAGLLKLGILPSVLFCTSMFLYNNNGYRLVKIAGGRLARGFVSLPWTLGTFGVLVEEEEEEEDDDDDYCVYPFSWVSRSGRNGSESRLSIKTNNNIKTVYLQGK